jgi:hypothetical protein
VGAPAVGRANGTAEASGFSDALFETRGVLDRNITGRDALQDRSPFGALARRTASGEASLPAEERKRTAPHARRRSASTVSDEAVDRLAVLQ